MSESAGTEQRTGAPGPTEPELYRRSEPALYNIAYTEGQRALDDQRDELNGLRQRATSYVALVGSATAFLVGATVKAAHRDVWFHIGAGVSAVVSIVSLIAAALLLIPRDWDFRLSAKTLIERWIEPDITGPTEANLLRGLADRYDEMREANEHVLEQLRKQYVFLVIVGGVAILCWAGLAVARA